MTISAVCLAECRCLAGRPRGARAVLFLVTVLWCFAAIESSSARQSSDPTSGTSVATSEPSVPPVKTGGNNPDKAGEPLELTFDNLKFDIEKGADFQESMLTEAIKKLDGQQVRLRGFVRPGFKQSGIKNFILVRDNQQCCFGPGAALYDCVMVKMSDGLAIDFTVRPICVVGTLQVKKYVGKDGKVWAIFRLNDTRQE